MEVRLHLLSSVAHRPLLSLLSDKASDNYVANGTCWCNQRSALQAASKACAGMFRTKLCAEDDRMLRFGLDVSDGHTCK